MNRNVRSDAQEKGTSRWRDDRGAAAVEFGLVLPLLMVMLFGIVEMGRAWNINQVITDAAREGARRAVVGNGLAGAARQTDVMAMITNRVTATGLSEPTLSGDPLAACTDTWAAPTDALANNAVQVSGCGWGGAGGTQSRVVIRTPYPFQILRPLLRLLPGTSNLGPVVLTSNFVMRNE